RRELGAFLLIQAQTPSLASSRTTSRRRRTPAGEGGGADEEASNQEREIRPRPRFFVVCGDLVTPSGEQFCCFTQAPV
ncbi:hypothetical protein AVEN_60919-1, partial [Araneus ventricosus]